MMNAESKQLLLEKLEKIGYRFNKLETFKSEYFLFADENKNYYVLPTYDDIIKYFIEQHKIYLSINIMKYGNKAETKFEVVPVIINENSLDYPIMLTDGSVCIPEFFDTYEEAQKAGINYVLDNFENLTIHKKWRTEQWKTKYLNNDE